MLAGGYGLGGWEKVREEMCVDMEKRPMGRGLKLDSVWQRVFRSLMGDKG